ncbi:MAG: hypothetical protein LCH52_05505 [Bacteroidetes bacterium]|nr:hypothetical protein [Bacteroidota bacterium]
MTKDKQISQFTNEVLDQFYPAFKLAFLKRNAKHGTRPLVSLHEAYGICAEELHEVMDAIWKHYPKDHVAKEFLDLAVAAFFAYYSFHEDFDEIIKIESVLESEAHWKAKLGEKDYKNEERPTFPP